jgi:probable rRNA maturation factor
MPVQFFFEGVSVTLAERNKLKAFLIDLFKKKRTSLSNLTYIFCSDEYLLNINKQFLQHDYYTDIITFNLAPAGQPIEGEIYISIDRVADNAKSEGVSRKEELHRVIFHGALHLLGHRDKSKKDQKMMSKAENKCLKAYFDVPRIPVSK